MKASISNGFEGAHIGRSRQIDLLLRKSRDRKRNLLFHPASNSGSFIGTQSLANATERKVDIHMYNIPRAQRGGSLHVPGSYEGITKKQVLITICCRLVLVVETQKN